MNYIRKSPASKGEFKCFDCRVAVRSKDGAWHESAHSQVFLCKPCAQSKAPKAPAFTYGGAGSLTRE